MTNIKVDRVEAMAETQFRLIVQASAANAGVVVRDSPIEEITRHVVVKMQVERNGIVQADIFVKELVTLHHTQGKSDQRVVTAPGEEAGLVAHTFPELTEVIFSQFLEAKF